MAQMLIGGERVAAASGEELRVLNPATEETIDSVPNAAAEDVDRAVQAAARAFTEWSRKDVAERADLLSAGVERLRAEAAALTESLTREQGKPLHEARGEVNHFLNGLEYAAELATKLRGGYQPLPSTLGKAYGLVIRRPIGVVGAIVPWNFPLTLLANKLGPALVAGNTVVAKPAETTPLTTLRVAEILTEVGLPDGVLNILTGDGPRAGEPLVAHPEVRRIAFTGQSATGQRIMEIAGPQLKRISLELGGSDPTIVCPDADLKAAVKTISIGRYWNAGQICLAPKRAYVFAEVYDAFVEQLVAQVQRYEPGDGLTRAEKPNIRVGPLHTERQRETLLGQMQDALKRDARLLCGGEVPDEPRPGYFFQPAVMVDAPHDSAVVQEEVFGPLLPVFKVRDLDEAVAMANDSPFGLGSSIWTYDARAIHRASEELETGMTWVNQLHYGYDEMPFGGVKASGVGKEHGLEALEQYYEVKSVVVGGLG